MFNYLSPLTSINQSSTLLLASHHTMELQKLQPLHGVAVALLLISAVVVHGSGLSYDYYKRSCQEVEAIVSKALLPVFMTDPRSPAAFLRLLFHDCQVQGCDASILLDSDAGTNVASEMESSRNFGIRNRETIEMVKSTLEMMCPGTVSCADVIALAAREAVAYSGGPWIAVPLGRKDASTASNRRADRDLPSPTSGVDGVLSVFMSKGMSIEETVAILGGHSIGVGHCMSIVHRLYSEEEKKKNQDNMDDGYEAFLRLKCPTEVPLTNTTFLFNDLTTTIFDNQYYKDIINGRGLFTVDAAMSIDPRTARYVKMFAGDHDYFFKVFYSAFVKLSSAVVLTGENGEIRKQCNRVN